MLRSVFVAEDQRPDVTMFIANVNITKEWYDANVVFEGCLARFRQPNDRVGPGRRVCNERQDHADHGHILESADVVDLCLHRKSCR